MVIAKAACPRCGRAAAVKRWEGKVPVPFRHKNLDGEWCSGTAKTRNELVLELVHATTAERDALREYSDELIRHSQEVVRILNKHTAAQEISVEIMGQITATYEADIAAHETRA